MSGLIAKKPRTPTHKQTNINIRIPTYVSAYIHYITLHCIAWHGMAWHGIAVHYVHTLHTCIHACMHTYIHACMHTFIHTYIHT